MEHDSAVWSLDVLPEGNLAVSGAVDGTSLSIAGAQAPFIFHLHNLHGEFITTSIYSVESLFNLTLQGQFLLGT